MTVQRQGRAHDERVLLDSGLRSWSDIDEDPNSDAVLAHNETLVAHAHALPVGDRIAYIRELARDRSVLDIGAVEHTLLAHDTSQWLHGQLAAVAKRCVGLDVLEGPCAALRSEGYDIRVHDIMDEPMGEQFELVVAGEVIEHVDSPGQLLAGAASALAPSGRLVLTTPNSYMLNYAWHGLTGKGARENADHVSGFNASHMLELGRRHGLRLVRWRGVRTARGATAKSRAMGTVRRVLSKTILAPESDCDTLVYEFVAAD